MSAEEEQVPTLQEESAMLSGTIRVIICYIMLYITLVRIVLDLPKIIYLMILVCVNIL